MHFSESVIFHSFLSVHEKLNYQPQKGQHSSRSRSVLVRSVLQDLGKSAPLGAHPVLWSRLTKLLILAV